MKKDKIIHIERVDKKDKNHTRNQILVNMITAIRSLGTIAIVPIFFSYGTFVTALAAAGFFLTDFIDGFLARKLHVQSFFGSLLDALSDKSFGIVCLLLLSTLNPIFLLIIAVEIGIFSINYTSIQNGNNAKTSSVGRVKTVLLAASIVGSYFCYSAPTLQEILKFINISSFNKILELNPNLISTILATPVIGASLYTASDYLKTAKNQDHEKEATQKKESDKTPTENQNTLNIEQIEEEKQKLIHQKEKISQYQRILKSREEILHDLFDTEFYLKNKDGGIKELLYKKRQ